MTDVATPAEQGVGVAFWKYHGLGNDYVVIHEQPNWLPAQTISVCRRHFGLGSDGVLVHCPASSSKGAGCIARLRILNPDGSESEKSGNGLRIFARYLLDTKVVQAEQAFRIETLGGVVTCVVLNGGKQVQVEMGTVRFGAKQEAWPMTPAMRNAYLDSLVADRSHDPSGFQATCADIGNPHCVVQGLEVSRKVAQAIGPIIETDARFANRSNVQFLHVISRSDIRIEIWERGAGYTLASGSSSCSAAAVARFLGLVERDVCVHMPGGNLMVSLADQDDGSMLARMTGPVVAIASGTIAPDVVNALETQPGPTPTLPAVAASDR